MFDQFALNDAPAAGAACMEPQAFDRLARACAAGGTRRRLVALLAALPVAGLLTTRSGDEAAAAGGKLGGEPCNENRDCQTFICLGTPSGQCTCSNRQSIGCANPAERCAEGGFGPGLCIRPAPGGVACQDGIECQSNQCLEGRCTCSETTGIPCKDRAQRCLDDRCVTPKRGGEPCNEDRECQTNTCDLGVCSCANGDRPVPCVELANPCVKNVCVAQECRRQKRDDGTACPSAGNPCLKDVCVNGQCTHPPKPDGAKCSADDNPCTDDVCANGQCTHPAKADGAKCGDRAACVNGTCRCYSLEEQVCPGKHGPCKLPLGQACARDDQCCPEQTCCRGKCRLKSGQSGCRTDDDCCVTHTADGGPICCGGTCCHTCETCNPASTTCIGAPNDDC